LQPNALSTFPAGPSSVTVPQPEPSLVTSFVTAAVTRSPALPAKVHLAVAPGLEIFIDTGDLFTMTEQPGDTTPLAAEADAGDHKTKLVTAATTATTGATLGAPPNSPRFDSRQSQPAPIIGTATPLPMP
jgi:hypothetical protein